jgi:hypothetical protein
MKKKEFEEFGILITRDMRSMMFDSKLSYEQRAKIFCAIVGDESTGDVMMDAFADSLKTGYISTNSKRKNEIILRKERQKTYPRNLRTSTEIDGEKHTSTTISKDERASLNKAKQSNIYISPLNPPLAGGTMREGPKAISADDILGVAEADIAGDLEDAAADQLQGRALELAERIENTEAFPRMRVNRKKLMKCLLSLLKKNGAPEEVESEVLAGIERWSAVWRAEDWRFAPGRITDWLYDGKYLEEPRKKEAAAEHDYGEVGVKEIV